MAEENGVAKAVDRQRGRRRRQGDLDQLEHLFAIATTKILFRVVIVHMHAIGFDCEKLVFAAAAVCLVEGGHGKGLILLRLDKEGGAWFS